MDSKRPCTVDKQQTSRFDEPNYDQGRTTGQGSSLRSSLTVPTLVDTPQLCDMLLALVEESPDALFIKDCDGRYLLCNSTVARLVGKPVEQILGFDDTALFDAEGAAKVMARDRRVMMSGTAEVEEEVLLASGQTRIYEAVKAPFWDSQGRLAGVIGISRDVTESRHAAEALHQSERVLKLVVDEIPVGLQILDLHGDVIITNPAAERIWGELSAHGTERIGMVGARWHDSGKPLEPDDYASTRALTRGEVSHNQVIDIDGPDGKVHTIVKSCAPIRDSRNEILGAVLINEDITDRLRLEKQFLQGQKMEAIGQLASGTAHDFNNLLSIISGYGDLLLQDLAADSGSRELVGEILEASKKAAALTKQLLAFSRKSVLDPQVLDLNSLVEESQGMLSRLLGEGIVTSFHLESSPCTAKVDPVQFDQLLVNLYTNARDAMPNGGTLSIRVSQSEAPEGFVSVVVTDSGAGMTRAVQEHVFEPFFTTKSGGRGTGLGLATVYGIMRQSGGDVEVESVPGQGSSFNLYFPFVPVEVREAPARRDVRGNGEERVLLVEDQDGVRKVLAKALERAGYSVTAACHGLEALELWESGERFDMVVTDIVMPGMSGRHLAERLREITPDVKVLYMSGHTTDSTLLEGVSPTETAWLQKPFTIDVLTRKVREILDQAKGS